MDLGFYAQVAEYAKLSVKLFGLLGVEEGGALGGFELQDKIASRFAASPEILHPRSCPAANR